jgi:hypothetical protein
MAGGWQMPAITGGTSSLYAAPGATGAMAPPSPNWLQDHPQVRNAMLQFGQSLLAQRAAGAQGAMGGPGISRGQWRPPQMHPGLPQSSSLPGPDTGAMGGPIGGMQQYAGGFNGQVGDPNTYAQLPITPNQSNMPGIGRFSNATLPPWMMGRGGGAMGGAAGGGMMGGGGPFWGGM